MSAFEEIPTKIASKPDLADDLVQFVNHWGLDAYTPPEHVIESVRQIVLLSLDRARETNAAKNGS